MLIALAVLGAHAEEWTPARSFRTFGKANWRGLPQSSVAALAQDQDRLRRFAETERMARHLPNTRFAILEDCGHMAPLERPRELTALLADWIRQSGL